MVSSILYRYSPSGYCAKTKNTNKNENSKYNYKRNSSCKKLINM